MSAEVSSTASRLPRLALAGASVLIAAACFAQAPGRLVADTKLDLVVDPIGFLARALHLWEPLARFGYVQNQAIGYLFPMGPFFAAGHALDVPMWIVQRAWWSLLLLVALWGAAALARSLGIGRPISWLLAGVVYALSPWFLTQIGATSAALLPAALLPWVLLPLVQGSRSGGSPRRAAALSGLAVLVMGGMNAAAALGVLVLPALWLLTREPSLRRRSLLRWWLGSVVLAIAWWLVPLMFQVRYGFDFLPYTEGVNEIARTTSAVEALRGTSNWIVHLHLGEPWLPAGWVLVSWPIPVLATAALAAAGLAGLARADLPERRFLVLGMAVGMVLVSAVYTGQLGGAAGPLVRAGLERAPFAAFKNVHKFEPVLLLPLALGLAHLISVVRLQVAARRWLALAVAAAVLAAATPLLVGKIPPPGSFASIPDYWHEVARFLERGASDGRVLVLPASDHAEFIWGRPLEEPLQPLSEIPWAEQDLVPLGSVGSYLLLQAVERRLDSGLPHPGLPHFLARAGIRYVVVRNDLDREGGDPRPLAVHHALLESGLRRVLQFGPTLGEIGRLSPPDLELTAPESQLPAVEVFDVEEPAALVATYPAETAMIVSGGPESLLQLADRELLRGRATLLRPDLPAEPNGSRSFAFTDTHRRRDVSFGSVRDNFSYTLADNERPPLDRRPLQQLTVSGEGEHQAVNRLEGVAGVTASSYGSWLRDLPELAPWKALDGDPDTAWVASNAGGSAGQWLEVSLDRPVTLSSITVRLLAEGPWRPPVTALRVTTEAGSTITGVSPDEQPQVLHTRRGPTRWVRVTFAEVEDEWRLAGAGLREIGIPGVTLRPVLELPQGETGAYAEPGAAAPLYAFDRAAASPYSVLRGDEETRLARRFWVPQTTMLVPRGTVVPRKGEALDALLSADSPLRVSASSSWASLPKFRAANLVDGDAETSWIAQPALLSLPAPPELDPRLDQAELLGPVPGAADPHPRITLRWPESRTLDRLRLVAAASGATPPLRLHLSSPAGERDVDVPPDGVVQFAPLITDRVEVAFPAAAAGSSETPQGDAAPLPVGLAELDFPALSDLRRPFDRRADFRLPCGDGPDIVIDGTPYPTMVEGTVDDLVALRPLTLLACGPGGALAQEAIALDAGRHDLEVDALPAFSPSQLTLSPPPAPEPGRAGNRSLAVRRWEGEHRELALGPGGSSYLAVRENFNAGWKASLEGERLEPIRLDGWQQGFVVPAGAGGTIELRYAPARLYRAALVLGLLAVVALLVVAAVPARRPVPPVIGRRRPPSWLTLVAFSGVVVLLIGGPLLVVLPILLWVALRRRSAIPWVAGGGMLAAGADVALRAPGALTSGPGAFGMPAQVLAVTAVTAVLAALVVDPWPEAAERWWGRVGAWPDRLRLRIRGLGRVRPRRGTLPMWIPWPLGLVAALVVLGPALRPGSLLSLDLVMTSRIPLPRGVWGLGPDLPRRVPLGVLLSWTSTLIGGEAAGKLLLVASLTLAFVGAWRLATGTPVLCRLAAGLLYTLSPFVLTRLGVGHWGVMAAIAVLPWALPHLLRPGDDLGRSFGWAAALGATGVTGGVYAGVAIAVGLLADRGRRAAGVIALFVVAQLPWLVPGAIVLASGPQLAQAVHFATDASGPLGALRLVGGFGFWRSSSQVGVAGPGQVLLAAGLLALAAFGASALPRRWGGRALGVAAVGLGASLASALPGLDAAYAALTRTLAGAVLRDGQRLLALFLVWLAPAVAAGIAGAAGGVRRSLQPAVLVVPAVAAVALAVPGLWGVGGQLEPVSFPPAWTEARRHIDRAPGTVLALPWHSHMDLSFAAGRRVYNPLPDFLGGDVMVSSDFELGEPSQEQADPRERHVRRIVEELQRGSSVSGDLARLGVRWVMLLHEVDWDRYSALAQDPGLEPVVQSPELELLMVRDWQGPVVDDEGRSLSPKQFVAPLAWFPASGPLTWQRPAAAGWMRGTAAAGQTEEGLLSLPAGGRLVWYWPAALTLFADAVTVAALVIAFRPRIRRSLPAPRKGQQAGSGPRGDGDLRERVEQDATLPVEVKAVGDVGTVSAPPPVSSSAERIAQALLRSFDGSSNST